MIVGTAVPTIIVRTTVPTMIAETNISLVAVPTTLVGTDGAISIVGTSVPTVIVGTKISLDIVPRTFLETVFSTNAVGTTIHINSLKRLVHFFQNTFNVFKGGHEQKILSRGIWLPSQNPKTRIGLLLHILYKRPFLLCLVLFAQTK